MHGALLMQRGACQMGMRQIVSLTLLFAGMAACSTAQRGASAGDVGANGRSPTTSVLGHWVLATPVDSTPFAGASQVDLVLTQGTFELTATNPTRAPLSLSGSADVGAGGLLTLVPAPSATAASAIGLAPGQPYTRVA